MEWSKLRNLSAFWLFGLCTDLAFVLMLSGAEDIINEHNEHNSSALNICEEKITSRRCGSLSTGAVLLADIIPMFIVKITVPQMIHKIPQWIRHSQVLFSQLVAFVMVAFANDVTVALIGVAFASYATGMGEVTYMAMTSSYGRSAIDSWSSGTGTGFLLGSVAYAGLTEPYLANFSRKTTFLIMLVVPLLLSMTYSFIIEQKSNVSSFTLFDSCRWIFSRKSFEKNGERSSKNLNNKVKVFGDTSNEVKLQKSYKGASNVSVPQRILNAKERFQICLSLLQLMMPLIIIYMAAYFINQGIVELILFDCSHGFSLSQTSQYRWFQVIFQVGVFLSRSMAGLYDMPHWMLLLLPVLQMINVIVFVFNAVYMFIPHISFVFILIFIEGFIGGSSYLFTFRRIYSKVEPDVREFSISLASISDSLGVFVAGGLTIPVHNFICMQPLSSSS